MSEKDKMIPGLKEDADGLHTNAEALAFVAYAVKQSFTGKECMRYAACIFYDGNMSVHTMGHQPGRTLMDVKAMENAAEMLVIEFCSEKKIKSVDIVYDLDKDIFMDRKDINGRIMLSNPEHRRRMLFENEDGVIDTCLYQENAGRADRSRILEALYTHQDLKWLKEQKTIEVFLTLAQKLADYDKSGLYREEELESMVHEAAFHKPVVVDQPVRGQEDSGEDEIISILHSDGSIDEELPGWEMERPGQTDRDDMEDKKTVIDLIIKYAGSIKKKKMTLFHILYGYACVSLMPVKNICEELELDEEAYGRISYFQGKIKRLFTVGEMDQQKLKFMIPEYIEYFENDEAAVEDYKKAKSYLEKLKKLPEYSPETIAYALLSNIVSNPKEYNSTGVNNVYLRNNKEFSLEKKQKNAKKESIEDIAGTSGRLYEVLTEKVIGQDQAVQKFVQGYVNAKLAAAGRKGKPAASYLFAGPPGVGKTYLAQLAAEVLGMPFKILDMSTYATEHNGDGLVGFESTYKDAAPGVLTTFVMDNPKSIILVDEIEKGHTTAKMLFLQILEGARLYDKYYAKDVSFENVIIIFTTNCGANLYQDNEDTDLSALSEGEVLDALREDDGFPNELCSRFASGNIIIFNHLKQYYLCDIVRNKMNGVAKELTENYQVQIRYDDLLPELFLFQIGGRVDARVASSRGGELLKDCMVSFVKDAVEKQGEFAADTVSVEIELKKDNRDIYPLFVCEKSCNILVISDSPKMRFEHPGIHVLFAENEDEAIQIIRENKIMFAIIDLNCRIAPGHAEVSNALGVDSVGRTCLDLLREKAPQIPVYILNQKDYHAQDKEDMLNAGVRGLFEEGKDEQECAANMEAIVKQLYIQNNLKLLSEKGQCVDYKTRYFMRENTGVVEFYNLSLRDAGMDDAELRKKAKSSKVFDFERPQMGFADIIGAEQAKRDMKHFINYMHNIDKYVLEGADIPRGILLYGPPGTGKTSLAKALAGECDALFLNTTGAGIRNAADPVKEIKDLFKIAYANAPAILFIDEIDVIAKERNGHDTMLEMLVNTLLTEMEGFHDKDPFKPVFVVAATNYNVTRSSGNPYEVVIDPALVRRFDNPVYVGLPSRAERKKYVQLLLEEKKYADKISEIAVDYVAEHTGGKSLAFLKRAISNMTNAAIDMQKEICDDLLTDTLETQLYGEKRENDDEYRLSVARHEAGHAYIGFKTGKEPRFITIVSRGDFGGYVSYGDGEDAHNFTKNDLLDHICLCLAGRASEEVYYGERGVNTGASSDLEKATKLAIKMICYFGMGSMGLLSLNPESVLDSPKGTQVLEEADRILDEQLQRAITLIRRGRAAIDGIVSVLMDKSYIQGENLTAILEEGEQAACSTGADAAKPHKWYVVINGRKPGIYSSWGECQAQVKGYGNAIYRSYLTEEAAKQAFQSARVGTRNIRDKKLLYHLVRLQDIEQILRDGLNPDMQIGEKKFVEFYFHAYAPEAVKEQKENPGTVYVYLCVTREYASAHGYQIALEQSQDEDPQIYSYAEGFNRIDWNAMEAQTDENGRSSSWCVTEENVSRADISYIYLPDEESAGKLKKLCRDAVITVNKRMFI